MALPPGLTDLAPPGLGIASTPRAASKGEVLAAVPHVVAFNLTQRCNLACAHCYIAAGPWHGSGQELTLDEGRRIIDQIVELNPGPLLVLSGGEPLLRPDLEAIARHGREAGATVVVGTNGTRLTAERLTALAAAGVTGFALSVDSLEPRYHDRFRHGDGALADTLAAAERIRAQGIDLVIQTTVTAGNRGEIPALAAWCTEIGAVCFNVYFLVETGRGAGMKGLVPEDNDAVLRELLALGEEYRGRLLVRSKCQPQIMRHAFEGGGSTALARYATRCPCGIQYCRITPEGKVTPCPYTPEVAGDLRQESFRAVWEGSPVFTRLRAGELGGRCGRCEYRVVCGGCRARALALTGDLLGEDPACAYQPAGDRPLLLPDGDASYGAAAAPELAWSAAAQERVARIPSFVRGVVMRRVETYAREHGHGEVTPELLDQIRREMPVDFSKKRPFFSRKP
jgi:radical SAM protein with 4Fe4S-binding SPASM domain